MMRLNLQLIEPPKLPLIVRLKLLLVKLLGKRLELLPVEPLEKLPAELLDLPFVGQFVELLLR